jgi:hypothetical protein
MFRILITMLNWGLFVLLPVTSVFAQEFQFQREIDTIPVIVNGVPVPQPFAGGFQSSNPTFADIDNDRDWDLFVGEFLGNINFYRNTGTDSNPIFNLDTENFASINVGRRSFPIFADIDNDGDLDLFVGEEDGNINFYRNIGTASNPNFTLETENLASIDVGFDSAPTFADIEGDGDFDLFVGELSAPDKNDTTWQRKTIPLQTHSP